MADLSDPSAAAVRVLSALKAHEKTHHFKVTPEIDDQLWGPTFMATLLFPPTAFSAGGEELQADLLEYARRYDEQPGFELAISIPADFPVAPPVVRVLHPVLIAGTGGILNGAVLSPELWPEGWDPTRPLETIFDTVRSLLVERRARIDLESYTMYNQQAFAASQAFLSARPEPAWTHPKPFAATYHAFSASFALEVMGLDLPEGFDAGNKVLLPPPALRELMRAPTRGAAAAAAADVAGMGLDFGAGASPDAGGEDGAYVFQITTALRYPVYVGVAGFTCPHPDAVILPDSVFQMLAVGEGNRVSLARVALPAAEKITVQPLTQNFNAVQAFSGKPPREYLEASLLRYTCLQPGVVIHCDGGPKDDAGNPIALHRSSSSGSSSDDFTSPAPAGAGHLRFAFTVVSLDPDHAPACALWNTFSAHVPIEFLPAADEFGVPRRKARVVGAAGAASGGAGSGGAGAASDVGVLLPQFAPTGAGAAGGAAASGAAATPAAGLSGAGIGHTLGGAGGMGGGGHVLGGAGYTLGGSGSAAAAAQTLGGTGHTLGGIGGVGRPLGGSGGGGYTLGGGGGAIAAAPAAAASGGGTAAGVPAVSTSGSSGHTLGGARGLGGIAAPSASGVLPRAASGSTTAFPPVLPSTAAAAAPAAPTVAAPSSAVLPAAGAVGSAPLSRDAGVLRYAPAAGSAAGSSSASGAAAGSVPAAAAQPAAWVLAVPAPGSAPAPAAAAAASAPAALPAAAAAAVPEVAAEQPPAADLDPATRRRLAAEAARRRLAQPAAQ